MWSAKAPTDDPLAVWDLCLQGIQDEVRQSVLMQAKPAAAEAHLAYMSAAQRGHFWGVNKDTFQR